MNIKEQLSILKCALQTEEGIEAILDQTGKNFRGVIDHFRDGDDTDLHILSLFMGIAATGRSRGEKESSKIWKEVEKIPVRGKKKQGV